MTFDICTMSPYSPTEAIAIIKYLKFLDWLRDGTHLVKFGIGHVSPDSHTDAVAVITDLDYLDWL